MSLTGQLAIVTGTSSTTGIGRATALALADLGASVVITDVATEPTADDQPAAKSAGMADLVAQIEG